MCRWRCRSSGGSACPRDVLPHGRIPLGAVRVLVGAPADRIRPRAAGARRAERVGGRRCGRDRSTRHPHRRAGDRGDARRAARARRRDAARAPRSDPPDAGLRAEDVRTLADAGFEVGFHTLRHDPLPQLDDEALRRAMVDGRAELEGAAPSLDHDDLLSARQGGCARRRSGPRRPAIGSDSPPCTSRCATTRIRF